ncbi:MAG TPA: hypothetical protein VNZ44_05410 [Pyrinomonadaceae bacterium]|nr:hypothetical protein [Pyrinomonadaceae bacterium]
MRGKRPWAALAALLLVFALAPTATARADEFDAVVRNVRAACGGKRVRIPFLGLANFATKFVRPAGVKSFKLAVFEDLSRAGDASGLGAAIGESLGPEWRQLVRVRSGHGAEQTHVYIREAGRDLKLMIVTLDGEQATVIRAKVNPEALARFAREPKVLGISLGGGD